MRRINAPKLQLPGAATWKIGVGSAQFKMLACSRHKWQCNRPTRYSKALRYLSHSQQCQCNVPIRSVQCRRSLSCSHQRCNHLTRCPKPFRCRPCRRFRIKPQQLQLRIQGSRVYLQIQLVLSRSLRPQCSSLQLSPFRSAIKPLVPRQLCAYVVYQASSP